MQCFEDVPRSPFPRLTSHSEKLQHKTGEVECWERIGAGRDVILSACGIGDVVITHLGCGIWNTFGGGILDAVVAV